MPEIILVSTYFCKAFGIISKFEMTMSCTDTKFRVRNA